MIFAPMKDRIVVRRDIVEDTVSESGILLSKEFMDKPNTGVVLATGPTVLDIKINDHVMFGKHDGVEHMIEGENLLILAENQVWGVLNIE